MGIIKVRILMTHLLEFTLEFIKDYAKLTFLKSRLDIFEYLLDWNYWSLCRHSEESPSMCFADQWDHSSSAWCYFIRIFMRKYYKYEIYKYETRKRRTKKSLYVNRKSSLHPLFYPQKLA